MTFMSSTAVMMSQVVAQAGPWVSNPLATATVESEGSFFVLQLGL